MKTVPILMLMFLMKPYREQVQKIGKIIAGENSAPGVISLIASCVDNEIKEKLK